MSSVIYKVEVKRSFVESTKEFTKSGRPKTFRITHRKVLLTDPNPIGDSGHYRIVCRGGRFTLSVLPRIRNSCWTNPSGKVEAWYTPAADRTNGKGESVSPYIRTNDPPMTGIELLRWLTLRFGPERANEIFDRLMSAEPE